MMICSRLISNVRLLEHEITHVETNLLDDRVAGLHVGTAGALVLDLVGTILVALGPAVDRRIELQAEGLDAVGGVETEQARCGWATR